MENERNSKERLGFSLFLRPTERVIKARSLGKCPRIIAVSAAVALANPDLRFKARVKINLCPSRDTREKTPPPRGAAPLTSPSSASESDSPIEESIRIHDRSCRSQISQTFSESYLPPSICKLIRFSCSPLHVPLSCHLTSRAS